MSNLISIIEGNPIPVASGIESFTKWITGAWAGLFKFKTTVGNGLMDGISSVLSLLPIPLFIALIVLGAYYAGKKKWSLPVFSFVGMLYILNQGLWGDLLNTVTIVIVASLLAVIQGVPLGILCAKSNRAEKIIKPILDFMQTMPSFVYLIPAVAFFGIGRVPGVFASVIFALPPTVRMTNLGIREIPEELDETAKSFGCTGWQKLIKVELPLARNTIMAGINQTNMLSLSMVVTASMIGAPGLGQGVITALQKADVGMGFVNGLALVVLAIIIDRYTQSMSEKDHKKKTPKDNKKKKIIIGVVIASIILGTAIPAYQQKKNEKAAGEKIVLSYVPWDSETSSAYVTKEVLESQGFDVELVCLDVAVNWQSIANGDSDVSLAAWLPVTHGEYYDKYKDDIVDLGPSLENARLGLVVPAYMDVDSIEDLSDQCDKKITAIEPGAGVSIASENTRDSYPNLSDWEVTHSSTGAVFVELGKAIDNHEEIIISGWSPHWIFNKYDVKYLEDPKGTMGHAESINAICRKGFKKDHPRAYEIVDSIYWTPDDMGTVMGYLHDGMKPEDAAHKWISEHPEEVEKWVK